MKEYDLQKNILIKGGLMINIKQKLIWNKISIKVGPMINRKHKLAPEMRLIQFNLQAKTFKDFLKVRSS